MGEHGALRRQLNNTAVVLSNPGLRQCQLALCLAHAVDLAQLVAVSAFLFTHGGSGGVAAYGVVRTVAPAIGVPVVTGFTKRIGYGRLMRLLAIAAAAGTICIVAVVRDGGPRGLLLGLAALVGICLGAFRPLAASLAPSLIGTPEELVACNGASGFLEGTTTLSGPAPGGPPAGRGRPGVGDCRDGGPAGRRRRIGRTAPRSPTDLVGDSGRRED